MVLGTAPSTVGSAAISGSVGRRARNRDSDVKIVQALLNQAGAAIKEDGDCGRGTISAIEDYQRNWTSHPDGRVDAAGMAWKRLAEGKLKIKRQGYSLLPQASGNGYYPYSSMDRQYGTPATVASLVRICKEFQKKYPDLQVGVGDMSFVSAAEMTPHKTHRNGRNADLRPLRDDGKMLPVTMSDARYSRARTKTLVEIIRADANFKSVLFNDVAIIGVTHWAGHDNHLHVSMKA
jgi:peptidoglycan hydrolase-like protein with peptidoglycan-binding domain